MKLLKQAFSFNQIKALLKKDLIVRLRQPWMLIVQFLWPCIIFVSLYIIRGRYQSIEIDDCQFPTRQLPSKNNLIPFFHSYICSIENKCENVSEYEEYSKLENAPLKPILNIAQIFLTDESLSKAVIELPIKGNWIGAVTTIATSSKFKDIETNIRKVIAVAPDVEKMLNGKFDIKKLFSDSATFANAGKLICGKPFPQNNEIRFVKDILNSDDFSPENTDELDSMPTPFCKQLYLDVTNTNQGKMTWTYVKPIIQGKILYGPDNEETASIMKFSNTTFKEMDHLRNFTGALHDIVTKLREDSNFTEGFTKLIEFAKSPFIQRMIGDSIDINQIENFMNQIRTDDNIRDAVQTVHNILECFSVDRFIPVNSDRELRDLAVTLNKKRLFYGSVYFNNTSDKNVVYKIRVDTDNTPKTVESRSRFWFPGPEGNMVEDMRYHRGFVQIKHSVDMGIIRHKKTLKLKQEAEDAEFIKSLPLLTEQNIGKDSLKDDFFSNDDLPTTNSASSSDDGSQNGLSSILSNLLGNLNSSSPLGGLLNSFLSNETVEYDEDFDGPRPNNTEVNSRTKRQLNLFNFDSLFGSKKPKADEFQIDEMRIFTKQFPYPPYIKDDFKKGLYLSQAVQMAFFLGLLLQIATCVRYRIWMNESKNTMLMRSMGLRASSEIITWIITTFIEIIAVFLIACTILYVGNIFYATGFIFIFIFLTFFAIGVISFCYMCSTIFSSASTGSVSSCILFLMSFLPYIVIICLDSQLSGFLKFITNLSFSTAFCYAVDHIMRYELQGVGMSFADAFYDGFNGEFTYAFCMIIFDTILYAIIGYFIQWLRNDEFKFHKVPRESLESDIGGIFQNVSKIYDDSKIAVNNITLTFPKDKVTCLLGRNGAGKSTIIKMLTGQIEPSTGKIILNQSKISAIDKIGLCSQDNILIPHLTAREHLELYAKIKLKSNFEFEVSKTMSTLSFGKYENYEAQALSGGYQRRLCVAIAFIGSPSVVILDEPCAGVDTKARKMVWELVGNLRKGRAVILATHFLDEAEYLSDSVVIMSEGNIITKHTPQTMKALFTKTFELSLKLRFENSETIQNIKNQFEIYLKSYKLISQNNSELKLSVAYDENLNNYLKLIEYLEELEMNNVIEDLTITSKNLETIFNNLNKNMETINDKTKPIIKSDILEKIDFETDEKNEFKTSINSIEIIKNLLWKRCLHFKRNYRLLLCILVLPALFSIIAMSFMQLRPSGEYDTILNLTRNLYPNTADFYSMENELNFTMEAYKHLSSHCHVPNNNCHEFNNSENAFYWILDTHSAFIMERYGGLTFNSSLIDVWYNNKGHHSMVAWLNDLNSNLLKVEMDDDEYGITTFNHPVKVADHEISESSILQQVADAGISLIVLIAFSLVIAGSSVYLVNERISGEKLQQKLCAVNFRIYWGVAFLWDLLIFLTALLLVVLIFESFRMPVYVDRSNLNGICLLIVLYGFAMIPAVHVFEKLFMEPSFANMAIFCMNVIIALTTLTVIVLFDVLGQTDTDVYWRHFFNRAFLIFPQHALADGLIEICKNYIVYELFKRYDIDTYKSPVASNLLLPHYLALITLGIIFMITNYLIESGLCCEIKDRLKNIELFTRNKNTKSRYIISTKPVELKIVSIQNSLNKYSDYVDEYALKVDSLWKSYTPGDYAVRDVSFQVRSGECFGLLGKNGAGKSTIFQILSGKIHQDFGYVNYFNKEIAYCPQTIALDPLLKVEEVIEFYGNLRKVINTPNLIDRILREFNLAQYRNVLVKNLSGGNRRKLNVAISCIGNTSLVLMDEPTTDMDPVTRYLVYKAINKLLANGRSVLLTSHAISEVDEVCQRVAIIKDGQLISCGVPEQLRDEFGIYYHITIFYNKVDDLDMEKEIKKTFLFLTDLQDHPHSIKFMIRINNSKIKKNENLLPDNKINDKSITLTNLLKKLNEFCNEYGTQFTITRCRLDVIFEKIIDINDNMPKLNGSTSNGNNNFANNNIKTAATEMETEDGGYLHKGFVQNENITR